MSDIKPEYVHELDNLESKIGALQDSLLGMRRSGLAPRDKIRQDGMIEKLAELRTIFKSMGEP